MAGLNLEEEASLTAMTLVRTAAEHRHDGEGDGRLGQVVEDYLLKVQRARECPAEGMNEPLGLLIGALAQLAGAAVLVVLAGAIGKPLEQVTDAELMARLDSLELNFLAEGGFRRG